MILCTWRRILRAFLLAGMLGAALAPVRAQQRTLYNSDSVPRDFVLALFATEDYASSLPELMIGEMPPLLAPRLPLPPDARVLGTFMRYEATSVYFESSMTADSLRSFMMTGLLKKGWRLRVDANASGSGFLPSTARPATSDFCDGNDLLTLRLVRQGGVGTLVHIRVNRSAEFSCGSLGRVSATVTARSRPLLTLINPTESTYYPPVCQTGLSLNTSLSSAMGLISTSLSTEQLLEHYGKQLGDSGWAPITTEFAESAFRTWERRLAANEIERITITITTPRGRPECKALNMENRATLGTR